MKGLYQQQNTNTIVHCLPLLQKSFPRVTEEHIRNGFAHVIDNTHLMGRWQTLRTSPTVVCDTGHNVGGFEYIVRSLPNPSQGGAFLRIILGMVNDKDVSGVLALLPKEATYYFTQASVARALPAADMQRLAAEHGLHGNAFPTVAEAYHAALHDASPDDFIFVGGSTFVVADLLTC